MQVRQQEPFPAVAVTGCVLVAYEFLKVERFETQRLLVYQIGSTICSQIPPCICLCLNI
jgi:hypothetical protein